MKIIFKIIFWTFWLTLGFIFHGVFISYFDDKDMMLFCLLVLAFWWGITGIITLVKWKKHRKENPALTKEQKNKQINKKIKYRNSTEDKKKYLAEVELENSYFGKGILLKNSENPENIYYTDIKSGFDRIFDSFGKKSDTPCDLYEFIVKEDNIDYVLTSLEKIYKKANQIMEECYSTIYKEIIKFFEEDCNESLKNEFNLDYLKKNWYNSGVQIYDDSIIFFIGIKAAENSEADSYYQISILVDYSTQEAQVSFEVVW